MRSSFAKASIWSALSEITTKLIGPISFLLLTRILSPADFGIVAVATTIISFLSIVSDLGISQVLIQEIGNKKKIKQLANAGFIINATLGIFFMLFMMCGADWLASLMNAPQSKMVIFVLSIQILFQSLSSIQIALHKKKLEFKFLFYTRLITSVIPALLSIPLAFAGFSYWAIIIGQIVGSFASTFFLWFKSDWKPSLKIQIKDLKYLISKSIWNTTEQLIIMIPAFLDTYLLSNYLGIVCLGIYSTCRTLFDTSITLTLGAINPVIFSKLSNEKMNQIKFKKDIIDFQKIIFSLSIILGIFVFLFSYQIQNLFFTEKWNTIYLYISPMFLLMSLSFFVNPIKEGLRASGKFNLLAINAILVTIIAIPILFFSIKEGLLIYIIARSSIFLLYFPLCFWFSNRYLQIPPKIYIINNLYVLIFSACLIITSTAYSIIYETHSLIIDVIGFAIFLIIVLVSNKELINSLLKK